MEQIKAVLMDDQQMDRSLMRIAHEIIEKETKAEEFLIIGIKRRGVPLADMLAAKLRLISSVPVITGSIDISLYRDDLSELDKAPRINDNRIPVDSIDGRIVILVDDVIYTGRTVRAAMDALVAFGRPSAIRFATLIDRGHRELPIRPDFVGKNVPTAKHELIQVHIPPIDADKRVLLVERSDLHAE